MYLKLKLIKKEEKNKINLHFNHFIKEKFNLFLQKY